MENATKALLIAAAILIAIVLISIGVFVLRQGQNALNSADLSEAEIVAYNSKFESYTGTQRGTNVNALFDRLEIVNRELTANGGNGITVTGNTTNKSAVRTNVYYSVTIKEKDAAGLITKIEINSLGSGSTSTNTNP